jgi:preprotein translocase subunit SecD
VNQELAPPCIPQALPELQGGQAVRCFQLGPPAVDASDVASAEVVVNDVAAVQQVTFQLSPEGAARLDALAKAVGLRGRAAIVVDGSVVSTPRFESTEFQGQGVMTGLDPVAAHRLAERLNRPRA